MLTDYLVLQLAMLGDDSFADAEESRLFHVALNRVKTSVTLIGVVRISVCEARIDFSTVTVAEGPFRP